MTREEHRAHLAALKSEQKRKHEQEATELRATLPYTEEDYARMRELLAELTELRDKTIVPVDNEHSRILSWSMYNSLHGVVDGLTTALYQVNR